MQPSEENRIFKKNTQDNIREFDDRINGLIRSNEIFLLAKRYLQQYRLNGYLNESDIIHEAYIRAREKVYLGQEIKNLPAWFNRTFLNIVREQSKRRTRARALISKLSTSSFLMQSQLNEISMEEFSQEDIANLEMIPKVLREDEIEILELRLIKDLTWERIGDIFVRKGEFKKNDTKLQSRLRKKFSRAMKLLKEEFESAKAVNDGGVDCVR